MKKLITLFFLAIIITGAVFSQDTDNHTLQNRSLSLGFQAGFTTGVGISLKKTFSPKFSLSTTIAPPFIEGGHVTFSSLGFTSYFNIMGTKHSRFFSYMSMAGFYWEDETCEYHYDPNDPYNDYCTSIYKTTGNINTGLGIGMELFTYDIAAQLMFGYAVYTGLHKLPSTFLTVEGGISFYIK